LVRLDSDLSGSSAMPANGEELRLGDVDALTRDSRIRTASRRLVERDVPQSIAQLAFARLGAGLDWEVIAERSSGWANADELALARRFVERIEDDNSALHKNETPSMIYWEVASRAEPEGLSADQLRIALTSRSFLGIASRPVSVPDRPEGPSLAIRVALDGPPENPRVQVSISASDARSGRWEPVGRFKLPEIKGGQGRKPAELAEAIAERALGHLVRVELIKGVDANGNKGPDRIRITNASPLILHGLMLGGSEPEPTDAPALRGLALAPRRTTTVTVTPKAVQRLGLRKGLHATAADLGGL
jgi:hypothetical protein